MTAAVERATRSIPVVVVVIINPVEQGFIPSMAHPSGNVTGFSFIDFALFGKSLQLLRQIAPGVRRVGFMFRPADHPSYDAKLKLFAADQQVLPTEVVRAAVSLRRRNRKSSREAGSTAGRWVDCSSRYVHAISSSGDLGIGGATRAFPPFIPIARLWWKAA